MFPARTTLQDAGVPCGAAMDRIEVVANGDLLCYSGWRLQTCQGPEYWEFLGAGALCKMIRPPVTISTLTRYAVLLLLAT
jgi:hypothetical protein